MPDNNFNFLTEPVSQPSDPTYVGPTYVGPNFKSAVKMTPRKFAQSVLEVFNKLGGVSWLMTQAEADPKTFLTLLQKLIPKSVQLDDLTGLQVNLIDQFGNQVQINAGAGNATKGSLKSGQLRNKIATGGTPPLDLSSNQEGEPPTDIDIDIKDTFS